MEGGEDEKQKEGSEGIRAEAQTPLASASSPKPSTPDPNASQPSGTPPTSQLIEVLPYIAPIPIPIAAELSVAAELPVHAWQYDELVFSDPPGNFLSILNSNPPTPLPPQNRRAKDQREAHKEKTESKKAKGRTSSVSRRATIEPMAVDPPDTPVVVTLGIGPGPGQAVSVGIPGEAGSADVPLEFTQEMEKGEWNRLNDARIKIVAEMDKWR